MKGLLERETDPRPLALVRIVVGLSAIALAVFVERRGLSALSADGAFHVQPTSWLPTLTPGLVDVVVALWIAFAIALTVGLFARLAAAGVAVVAAASMALELQAFSNHVTLLVALSALLALGNPSAAWSLDARRRGPRASIPYWPSFLIKFQISTVYAYAALSKLNESFLSAEVLGSRWEPVVGDPVGVIQALLVAIAVSTVLAESFLAVALWSERFRRIAVPLGLALHVVIPATLGAALIPFSTLMLGAYVLFPAWRRDSRRVVWDARLDGIVTLVRAFRRLDRFGVHDFGPPYGSAGPPSVSAGPTSGGTGPRSVSTGPTSAGGAARPSVFEQRTARAQPRAEAPGGSEPEYAADRALALVGPDERVEGYDAARIMLEQSPVTFLIAPLLGTRLLAPLGRRGYRRLASRSDDRIAAT